MFSTPAPPCSEKGQKMMEWLADQKWPPPRHPRACHWLLPPSAAQPLAPGQTDVQTGLCLPSAAGMHEGLGIGPGVRVGGEIESLMLDRAGWKLEDRERLAGLPPQPGRWGRYAQVGRVAQQSPCWG